MKRYILSSDARQEMFEGKARYAERKAKDNIEIAMEHGMSEEQAYAISNICSYRHEIHCTNKNNKSKSYE